MKNLATIAAGTILLVSMLNSSLLAQQNKAGLYMDKINRELNAIIMNTWDYTSEIAHGKNARKAEAKRKALVRTSKLALERVSKLDDFNGSAQYRDTVVSFLRINYLVLNEDYEKILNMEEIAEQSYDLMEAYMLAQELADQKLDSAYDRLIEQQKLFALENNINLVENKDKLTTKLEKVGAVTKHYHEVYLVFFKCYKQEAYLVEAMNKKDVNAMEQNRNALVTTSAEGLEKLKKVPLYKNDKSLIYSCKSALEFYHKEAAEKMGPLIDFYMQQENFHKLMASFDSKPQKDRTNEDIAQHNAAIKDFNKQLAGFNQKNAELNKSRTDVLNNWNVGAKNFLDKNIPKYK